MERRLTVEEDDVAVHHVAMDNITRIQDNLARVDVAQRDHTTVRLHDGLGTRVGVSAVLDELVEFVAVELGDPLGHRQVHGDLQGNTQFPDTDVRVRGDDGTSGEFHTLTLNVASNASLLRPQALLEGLEGAP